MTARRARALQAAVSGPAGGRPVDGPAREVALVGALRELGGATARVPSEEFRAALRTRLLAVAAVQAGGQPAPAAGPPSAGGSWRLRAATVTAGVLASAVAVTGVSAAASMSLPGDPFYVVKRTAEDVQLAQAEGPSEQGVRNLQLATTRLHELRRLALGRDLSGRGAPLDADRQRRVAGLLADMDTATRRAQRLLTEAFRAGSDVSAADRLARFARTQDERLREVLPALPADVRPRAQASLTLVTQLRTSADELGGLRGCTAACDPGAAASGVPDAAVDGPAPCGCPVPAPDPSVAPPPAPTSSAGTGERRTPLPSSPAGPQATPSSPAPPAPSPSVPPSGEPPPPASVPDLPVPTLSPPAGLPALSPLPGLLAG